MRIALRLIALFALCGMLSVAASAAPAQVKTQAPGFYRYAVGDFEVTALYDGYLGIDPALLDGIKPDALQKLLARSFLEKGQPAVTSVNAYLVNMGDHLVMVDAGTAKCFNAPLGRLPQNLRAAGYAPEDVDTILITHLHGDHICGLVAEDGKPAFPNAAVWMPEADAAYWLDEKTAAALPENKQTPFRLARQSVAPIKAAGLFHLLKPGAVLPGVTALDISGHTPGQTAYLFQSKGEAFLAVGDIVHLHMVQFARPETSLRFDVDRKAAMAARRALMEKVSATRWAIGGAHLPFPGIGHVRKEGKGFAFVPVDYSPMLPE